MNAGSCKTMNPSAGFMHNSQVYRMSLSVLLAS